MQNLICVKIEGLNIARIIDRLVSASVFVGDVKIAKSNVKFFIYEKDLKTLKRICKLERKRFEIVEQRGIKKLASNLKRCLGLIVALAVVFCYLFSYHGMIFEIDLVCAEDYDLNKVEKVLENAGVVAGAKNTNADIKTILLKNLDDLQGCSVEKNGGKIKITIFPAVMKEDVQVKNLVSNFDAVITFAEAYSGELKVKVGDIVKKGDVLIDSEAVANGLVKGKVYFSATEIYNEKQTLAVKTGKYVRMNNLKIGNKYFYKSSKFNKFSSFITEKCSFYLSENNFLPIICEEIYCFETQLKETIIPFENVEKEIMKKVYDDACLKIDDLDSVKNVSYSVVKDGSYTRVDCFVETEIMLFKK